MSNARDKPMKDTMNILKEAWEETLTTDYQDGILSYERDLQAAFYHHVRIRSKDKLTLFNEVPKFMGQGKPDLVVCRGKAVDAVIEFKFAREKVQFRADMAKLARWANTVRKVPRKVNMALNPKTVTLLDDDASLFAVSAKTNWVYAVVATDGWDAVSSTAIKQCLQPKRKNVPWSRFWHFTGTVQANGKLRHTARHL